MLLPSIRIPWIHSINHSSSFQTIGVVSARIPKSTDPNLLIVKVAGNVATTVGNVNVDDINNNNNILVNGNILVIDIIALDGMVVLFL